MCHRNCAVLPVEPTGKGFGSFPQTVTRQSAFAVVKVFARLFQKAARSRTRSPRRAPQSAKLPCGAFFLQLCEAKCAFLFAPTWSKKKRERNLCFLGNKPFGRTVYLHLYKQYTTKSRACQGRRVPWTRKNARTLDERIIL